MSATAAPTTVPAFASDAGTVAGPTTRERLLALDVFRGLTIAGMLLVNNPGSWSSIYPPLRHAAWHGWTPTDLIFPFFLFIVGITTHLSLEARKARGASDAALVRQVLRRGALIFGIGVLLNAFPFFTWGAVPDVAAPSLLDRVAHRLEHLRIMGVLQRIGLAYAAAALLTLRTTLKQQVVVLAALLCGYWLLVTLVPVPGTGYPGALVLDKPALTLQAWLDQAVLGRKHIWSGSATYDPEGLLSTFPAVGTALLGVLAGRWIGGRQPLSERIAGLYAAGALGMMVGLMWNWSFPINKPLWTSSYVVFTAGMACTALATCLWLIDVRRVTWWTRPLVIYGVNPITAFVGSGLMARLIYSVITVPYDGAVVPLQTAIYRSLYASWLAPRNASLAFAFSFVLVWLGILWVLHRRNVILKV